MYDAFLLVSFGGPERREDVIPFLENVLRGRNVPRERMLEVAEHYYHFGGVSPINEQNRALLAALKNEFENAGLNLPLYWGNRNWTPLLPETLQQMKADGVRCAIAFFTATFSSYSGCRQYWENIAAAQAAVGEGAPQIDKLRAPFNHPDFIEPMIERTRVALDEIPADRRAAAQLLFTAHSIPLVMATGCQYEAQFHEASRLIAEGLGHKNWRCVYQSRSGPPTQPWLEPDIGEAIEQIASEFRRVACDALSDESSAGQGPRRNEQMGRDIVAVPVGFISDHIEVLYDLDIEAKQKAESLGVTFARAATVGTHPRFVRMIRELIEERMTEATVRPALGALGPGHDVCPPDCCPRQAPRP